MSLKGKRILITAGPTWIALDEVRVISNVATGENGIILAEELRKLGARVTLLLGPINPVVNSSHGAKIFQLNKKIRLLKFTFFEELKNTVIKELKKHKYDCLFHSAAVSDYQPDKRLKTKVSSGKISWPINLVPTPKIIDLIRKADPKLFLVGFKFEPNARKGVLLKDAKDFMERSGSNLVVANTLTKNNKYLAYITDGTKIKGPFKTKKRLSRGLAGVLKQFYGEK